MMIVVYILAAIGGLVVTAVSLFFLAWGFVHAVARAEIRRKARLAALTLPQTQ